MKNIKNIVIGIFAVIGFGAIVTGFTNEAQQTTESHVWDIKTTGSGDTTGFLLNKETGEAYWLRSSEKTLITLKEGKKK